MTLSLTLKTYWTQFNAKTPLPLLLYVSRSVLELPILFLFTLTKAATVVVSGQSSFWSKSYLYKLRIKNYYFI